ncbi:MAG: hypothetical protein Kow0069_00310 [Promethearchaeota archaeon]
MTRVPRMRIVFVEEFSLMKRITRTRTMGGIETNTVNVIRNLRKRGHVVRVNEVFDDGGPVDVVASSTYGPYALLKVRSLKKKLGAAVVQHAHTTVEDLKGGGFVPGPLHSLLPAYVRTLYGAAHLLVTPSPYSRSRLRALGLRKPIHVVSNGVDFSEFHPDAQKRKAFRAFLEREHGIPADAAVVLNVGVTWPRKGVDRFVAAARRLPEYWFVWVGPVVKNPHVAAGRRLPNVRFVGYREDACEAYCGADAFFFPSYEENQGIPLIEAAACRVPVVASDLEAFDWLVDGTSARLGSGVDFFVEALREVVEREDVRKKLVDAAEGDARRLHDIEAIASRLELLYHRATRLRDASLERFGRS